MPIARMSRECAGSQIAPKSGERGPLVPPIDRLSLEHADRESA